MRTLSVFLAAAFFCVSFPGASNAAGDWTPAESTLMTSWGEKVSPDNVLPEYPRPQMARDEWVNLNGLWDYAVTAKDVTAAPSKPDGEILVPFAIESALSGVKQVLGAEKRLWYRRSFDVPDAWRAGRVLLHFGAVDWEATVSLNGKELGTHRGGFDPFSFDITDALADGGVQELVVNVWDPTNDGFQPRGKQVKEPKGIYYTAVSGIWQTVWLELVPEKSIERLDIAPDIDAKTLTITVDGRGVDMSTHLAQKYMVKVIAKEGRKTVAEAMGVLGAPITLKIAKLKLWSPDSPFLYDLRVEISQEGGNPIDTVDSYFAMRKISMMKDEAGIPRLALNNEIGFQYGPLDQGWWPGGLYTAPSDEALRFDIEMTKRMGFKMIRKHVKVEPDRWFYHCDKLGMLVWQDMPSCAGRTRQQGDDIAVSKEHSDNFEHELRAMIAAFKNHPCVISWVPYNEGWGQYETARISALTKSLDPPRLVNAASGWADRGVGDIKDKHSYPNPRSPELEETRVSVQGEFGGLGLPVQDHLWWDKRNWGYRTLKTREELATQYEGVVRLLLQRKGEGVAAGVYTQTTDVEGEVNGLMTYDRKVIKFDIDWIRKVNERLYGPVPIVKTIVPTSQAEGREWKYTTTKPPANWANADFADSKWKTGAGVFGTKNTPGAKTRTTWKTSDIWIRREVKLTKDDLKDVELNVLHDEDAEVYINGALAAKFEGYTATYVMTPPKPEARKALRPGVNTIAVHCHQTSGGQAIDVGLVRLVEGKR